jgi:hypothetical protein
MPFAALVILVLAPASGTFAQARPDLSGTWRLNFDLSESPVGGGGIDVTFPSEMVVTQSTTELSLTRRSVRQAPFAAVYRLDGSKVSVDAPPGITETGEARFEGAALVITSRRSFSSPAGDTVVEFRETWSVSGNVLTVKKTVTQDGESQNASAAYDRGSGR